LTSSLQYPHLIREPRAFPPVAWPAVGVGVLIAVVVALLLSVIGERTAVALRLVAPFSGIASGAFLAGNRAKVAPLYHGALVAAGYVLLEGVGLAPSSFEPRANAVEDTIAIIVSDVALLALGAFAGQLGSFASFSGKGRGR
jgi:hypothetical protein